MVNSYWAFSEPPTVFYNYIPQGIFSHCWPSFTSSFPLLDLLTPSSMLPLKYFELQHTLFFSVVTRKCILFFLSCKKENSMQVKHKDLNWFWRVWAQSCLGAVLPWTYTPEQVTEVYDATFWVKIIIYYTTYNLLGKLEATTISRTILYLRKQFWFEKSKWWVMAIHTISQGRCECICLAFSWSQNSGWAHCLYLSLVQSLSVAMIYCRRVSSCLILNCYCRSVLYILQITYSLILLWLIDRIEGVTVSGGKSPNIILLRNY